MTVRTTSGRRRLAVLLSGSVIAAGLAVASSAAPGYAAQQDVESGFSAEQESESPYLVQPESVAPQAAPGDVVFDGGGWGHGVGMSQYGAYGMSVLGAADDEILAHYYQGSFLGRLGPNIGPIWVNLERDFSLLTLRVEAVGAATPAPVTISHPWRSVTAQVGATLTLLPNGPLGCRVVVYNPGETPFGIGLKDCRIDFDWYDWTDEAATPTTKLVIDGCTLANWNTTPTSYPECQYARGMLHLRAGDGGLDLSAKMVLEDYVLGISEMPYFWADTGGAEALQAQAVAARSYARELRLVRGNPADNSCDGWCHVRDTTFDQRYVGWGHGNLAWVDAVRATEDRVVAHLDAPWRVVRSYYFSSSAGLTEAGHERFASLDPAEYYTSVTDTPAVDGTVPNPWATWVEILDAAEVASALEFDELTGVTVSATRPSSGSASMVRYDGLVGEDAVSIQKTGTWTRTTFGLRSEFFTVTLEGVAAAPTPEPGTEPTTCVTVQAGDGWWTTTVRLGLAGSDYPVVREANLDAENEAGHLIVGAVVCAPAASSVAPAPAPTPPPAAAVCTVVLQGESWWHQAEKLGITGAQWPALLAANAGAVAENGALTIGAAVCLPGSSEPPPAGAESCTMASAGEGWIAVGARLGWPFSEWRTLAAANPEASNAAGSLRSGAEVCLP